MTDTPPTDATLRSPDWAQVRMTFLDRLPLPYWTVVLGVLLLGLVSIGLETLLKLRMATGWGALERRELILLLVAAGLVILFLVLSPDGVRRLPYQER